VAHLCAFAKVGINRHKQSSDCAIPSWRSRDALLIPYTRQRNLLPLEQSVVVEFHALQRATPRLQ
jgi:hypothetical protein